MFVQLTKQQLLPECISCFTIVWSEWERVIRGAGSGPERLVALHPRKRDGLLGMGQSGKGMKECRPDRGNCPKKTGETVDHRQNNGSVKAVSCPLTIAQRLVHCAIAVSTAVLGQSQRQCPLHCCWRTTWTTQSKGSPTFSAQLHLPTHDLFWANLRVQLHLPPLRSFDLAWNPDSCLRNGFFILHIFAPAVGRSALPPSYNQLIVWNGRQGITWYKSGTLTSCLPLCKEANEWWQYTERLCE